MATGISRNRAEGKRRIATLLAVLCFCVCGPALPGSLAAAEERPAAKPRELRAVPKDKLYANDKDALWLLEHTKPQGAFPGRPIPTGPRARTVRDYQIVWAAWLTRHTVDTYRAREKPDAAWREQTIAFMRDAIRALSSDPRAPSWARIYAQAAGILKMGNKDPAFGALCAAISRGNLDARRTRLLTEAYGSCPKKGYGPVVAYFLALRLMRGLQWVNPEQHKRWRQCAIRQTMAAIRTGGFAYGEAPIAYWILTRDIAPGNENRNLRRMLFEEVVTIKGADPWLVKCLEGSVEVGNAWQARGGGWARTVTKEGWKGFAKHLKKARLALTEAWQLHPGRPEPATEMIAVAMAGHAERGHTPRFWFDRAVAGQMDWDTAYTHLQTATLPRWCGSLRLLKSLGEECLATKRFDTAVPWEYLRCLRVVASELQPCAWRGVYREPGVRENLSAFFTGLLPQARTPEQRNRVLMLKAVTEAWCGDYAAAARVLAKTPPKTPIPVTAYCRLPKECPNRWYFEGELRAFNGPHEQELLRAEKLSLEGNEDEAIPLFVDVLKKLKGDRASRAYLCKRTAILLLGAKAKQLCGAWQPLHLAAMDGDLGLAKFIVENGGYLNERTDKWWTPLLLAVRKGHLKIADLLIKHGADINARNSDGWSALHFALRYGRPDTAKELIKRKAQVNVKMKYENWTPLHLAVAYSTPELVKMLLEHGADPNARMATGDTPLTLARSRGRPAAAKVLTEFRSKKGKARASGPR